MEESSVFCSFFLGKERTIPSSRYYHHGISDSCRFSNRHCLWLYQGRCRSVRRDRREIEGRNKSKSDDLFNSRNEWYHFTKPEFCMSAHAEFCIFGPRIAFSCILFKRRKKRSWAKTGGGWENRLAESAATSCLSPLSFPILIPLSKIWLTLFHYLAK